LLNQFNDDNFTAQDIVARWSQMYLANKHYGTLNWGPHRHAQIRHHQDGVGIHLDGEV
jgi:hypothetical protein